jgi:hypothetical protein
MRALMEDPQFPSELQQIERDLANCFSSAASGDLRQRVLNDVRSRLRAERSWGARQFALAVAAVALLWINLSISATQATDFDFRPKRPAESVAAIAQQIRKLMPEFSPEDARR